MKDNIWLSTLNRYNAGWIRRENIVYIPRNDVCLSISKILYKEGIIMGYVVEDDVVKVTLRWVTGFNSYRFKLISKPSRRIYKDYATICKEVDKEAFLSIYNTSYGILSNKEIVKKNLKIGGELVVKLSLHSWEKY